MLCSSKSNDHLEKKKQWIDAEIEKILARQKDIDMLEAELRERDRSLKKKEELKTERDQLEVKKTKSSISISKVLFLVYSNFRLVRKWEFP